MRVYTKFWNNFILCEILSGVLTIKKILFFFFIDFTIDFLLIFFRTGFGEIASMVHMVSHKNDKQSGTIEIYSCALLNLEISYGQPNLYRI